MSYDTTGTSPGSRHRAELLARRLSWSAYTDEDLRLIACEIEAACVARVDALVRAARAAEVNDGI